MPNDLNQQIAELTAQHNAALEALIAKAKRENFLRSLCPEGFEPESFSFSKYDGVDHLRYEVSNATEVRAAIDAWHAKYGAFLPVGEYRTSCTTVTAHPWDEYAAVEPRNLCHDGVVVSNHVGTGFNSLQFDFYPKVPGEKIRVTLTEKFRAGLPGFHGHVSANYDQRGEPIYNSIHKVPPPAFKDAAFTVRYGSGSDDAANFVGVFAADKVLPEVS